MVVAVTLVMSVVAHSEDEFGAAEELIQQKISCSEITDDQLELIGDYYMEQMHPGEAHERMDAFLGGEGSDNLRQMHILLAKNFYCGDHQGMTPAMMSMMMGQGMMGYGSSSGWLGSMMGGSSGGMMGWSGRMMGGYGWSNFFLVVYVLLLIGVVVLIALLIIKLWRSMRKK